MEEDGWRWSIGAVVLRVDAEAWAIGFSDEGVGFGGVGGPHVFGVPLDGSLEAGCEIADEEGLGEVTGVPEAGLCVLRSVIFAGLEEFLSVSDGSGDGLGWELEIASAGGGEEARVSGPSAADHDAAIADEHDAIVGDFELVFDFWGCLGEFAAVVPGDCESGAVGFWGEVVGDDLPGGIGVRSERAGICFGGDGGFEVEGVEGGVHVMDGHIAEGAGAEIEVASPSEGVDVGVIGAHGRAADEEIPVDVRWDGSDFGEGFGGLWPPLLFGAGDAGAVGPAVDFVDGADGAGGDPLAGLSESFAGMAVVSHLSDEAGIFCDLGHESCFLNGMCHRFFDVDMFSCAEGGE